jgi:hypothetical protein
MTEAAIISGSLVDVRNVGTHKSVKLTIHVPEELAMQVMKAFGWPTGVNPVEVAIARLEQPVSRPVSQAEKQPGSEIGPQPSPVRADKPKRSIAQRAGMLCNDTLFHAFLRERFADEWHDSLIRSGGPKAIVSQVAAHTVRTICNVTSRKDINEANTEWHALQLAYEMWVRVPDMVPA